MINQPHIRHSSVPMYGSSTTIPMIEELVTSPHFIVIPSWVRIDCLFVNLLFSNVPCNPCVFEEPLLYHLVSLFSIPLVVVECEVIPLYPNSPKCDASLSRRQILEYLLSEVGNFLPKIPCCQSNGFCGPFCHGLAFIVSIIPMEKSHASWAIM